MRGTDVCNRHFIDRNNRFWALLWPSLYTSSYAQLPFCSSFCLGSGKQRYANGDLCDGAPRRSWFDLDRQALQLSVPQHLILYNFDDSFDGGCCLQVLAGDNLGPRRLFCVDWPLNEGLVIAYAYKAIVPDEDMSLWLRTESLDGTVTRVKCGSGEKGVSPTTIGDDGHRRLFPLADSDLRAVLVHLEAANEKILPTTASNEWIVRYYYLTSGTSADDGSRRVTDIGVGTHHGQGTYLGAVHVHRGSQALNNLFGTI